MCLDCFPSFQGKNQLRTVVSSSPHREKNISASLIFCVGISLRVQNAVIQYMGFGAATSYDAGKSRERKIFLIWGYFVTTGVEFGKETVCWGGIFSRSIVPAVKSRCSRESQPSILPSSSAAYMTNSNVIYVFTYSSVKRECAAKLYLPDHHPVPADGLRPEDLRHPDRQGVDGGGQLHAAPAAAGL